MTATLASTSRAALIARVLALALAVALPTSADPTGASPETLFLEARQLMKAGDCSNALPLLQRSHTLQPTLGTRFNMAICEARLGQLLSAAEHLRSVIENSPPGEDRRLHAERALRALSPRIPRLIVELQGPDRVLERVRLDGNLLTTLRANEPLPIDPGPHKLEVVLVGGHAQVREFKVSERETYRWILGGGSGTRAVARSTAAPNPPARDVGSSGAGSKGSDTRAPVRFWSTPRVAAVASGASALAALAIGTGFALRASSTYAASGPYCSADNFCKPRGVEQRDRALEQGRIATIAVTVGVAASIAGATLWFTNHSRSGGSVRVGVSAGSATRRLAGTLVVMEAKY